jgi:hypothetical protein
MLVAVFAISLWYIFVDRFFFSSHVPSSVAALLPVPSDQTGPLRQVKVKIRLNVEGRAGPQR